MYALFGGGLVGMGRPKASMPTTTIGGQEWRRTIRTGDILLTEHAGMATRIMRFITNGVVSHSAMAYVERPGDVDTPILMFEMVIGSKSRLVDFDKYYMKQKWCNVVWRPLPPDTDRLAIASAMIALKNSFYSFQTWNNLPQVYGMQSFLEGEWSNAEETNDARFSCSELTRRLLINCGLLHASSKIKNIYPQDFLDDRLPWTMPMPAAKLIDFKDSRLVDISVQVKIEALRRLIGNIS